MPHNLSNVELDGLQNFNLKYVIAYLLYIFGNILKPKLAPGICNFFVFSFFADQAGIVLKIITFLNSCFLEEA